MEDSDSVTWNMAASDKFYKLEVAAATKYQILLEV